MIYGRKMDGVDALDHLLSLLRLTARCGRCSTVVQTDRKVGEQMNPTRFILG